MLQEFLDDGSVTEIMVNGFDRIFLEKEGKLVKSAASFSSREKLEDVIQQIVAKVNRTVNEANPIVDAAGGGDQRAGSDNTEVWKTAFFHGTSDRRRKSDGRGG